MRMRQHFGRNKVEYVNFDFQVLETEHFAVYYYPSRGGRRSDCLPSRRTVVLTALEGARPRPRDPPAADPLWKPTGIRANQRRRRLSLATGSAASPNQPSGASSCHLRRRWRRPIEFSATRSPTRFSSTSRSDIAAVHVAAVGGRGTGPVPVAAGERPRRRQCGCATPSCSICCRIA